MNMSKIKEFVNEHKKAVIAASLVIGGGILVVIGCKGHSVRRKLQISNGLNRGIKDVPISDGLKVWNTTSLWREKGYLNGIVESIPLDDLGDLGKQFIADGLAQPGDIASIIIGIGKD